MKKVVRVVVWYELSANDGLTVGLRCEIGCRLHWANAARTAAFGQTMLPTILSIGMHVVSAVMTMRVEAIVRSWMRVSVIVLSRSLRKPIVVPSVA
jgi:hypothetical protein